jgi:hypothetical protein
MDGEYAENQASPNIALMLPEEDYREKQQRDNCINGSLVPL